MDLMHRIFQPYLDQFVVVRVGAGVSLEDRFIVVERPLAVRQVQ